MRYYKRILLQQYLGSGAAGAASSADNSYNGTHGNRMMMDRSPRVYLNPYSFIERTPHNTLFNIVPQGH